MIKLIVEDGISAKTGRPYYFLRFMHKGTGEEIGRIFIKRSEVDYYAPLADEVDMSTTEEFRKKVTKATTEEL